MTISDAPTQCFVPVSKGEGGRRKDEKMGLEWAEGSALEQLCQEIGQHCVSVKMKHPQLTLGDVVSHEEVVDFNVMIKFGT